MVIKLKKIENIFIWVSVIFLTSLIFFFSYRFIYYYRLNSNNEIENNDLYDKLLDNRANLNLHKIDNSYYFDKNIDNYVIYSGIVWRIIKIEDRYIQLISDIPIANMYYENVLDYLNNEFYDLLDKRLLVDKITLLSFDYYDILGGIDSFVNNGYYTYLDDSYYISDLGKINNVTTNDLYGIKPVITIKTSNIISGIGSKENPYLLDESVTNLKEALVGNYVSFSNKIFRIIENKEYTKLILDDVIEYNLDISKYENNTNLYNYLNETFYNTLDIDKIISTEWYNGYFDNSYEEIKNSTINTFIALANINDLFINDKENYVLMSTPKLLESMYVIKNNGMIYEENNLDSYKIRPVLSIKNDIKVIGIGTKNSPYVVGDINEKEN